MKDPANLYSQDHTVKNLYFHSIINYYCTTIAKVAIEVLPSLSVTATVTPPGPVISPAVNCPDIVKLVSPTGILTLFSITIPADHINKWLPYPLAAVTLNEKLTDSPISTTVGVPVSGYVITGGEGEYSSSEQEVVKQNDAINRANKKIIFLIIIVFYLTLGAI